MITVRFASGFAIQYNAANYAVRVGNGYTDLYDREGGNWIAQVPTAGCVVERSEPCRLYQSVGSSEVASDFLTALKDEQQRDRMSTYTVTQIKRALEAFDARRRVWK